MIRRIAVLLVCVLAVSGCSGGAHLFAVQAVAAGVPSLAPFFDEKQGLGHDAQVRSLPVRGTLQQGDTPGLYGGTRQPTICDVAKLKRFLTDPANHQKAVAWSSVLGITTDGIPSYLDRLTPVLLRHDTLVQNHDYKKGKATPYNSLLQAGIAILVDEQGEPAAKCSCGNPLRPFKGDAGRISVKFADGNKKWSGYEPSSVVAVRPAPRKMEGLALVDVDDPDVGITRPVGTTGKRDATFDTRRQHAVPNLMGSTFGEARRQLVSSGLAVGYGGNSAPSDDARVTASDPPAGTELRFGQYVTLTVSGGASGGATGVTSTPPAPTTSGPTVGPPTSTAPPSTSTTAPPTTSSPPASPPSSPPPSSPKSEPPPSSSPPSSTPTTGPPSVVSSSPVTSAPVTTSAAPTTSVPVTSGAPVTTSASVTRDPVTGTPTTTET
ncbi:PASTA domain-containing protein [Streptomyces sp. MBT62]|uniref:PASTA domain-containing protein n=1 Tax=Streptomyces sp. MBT62 TaxID=2800410 RepID=UPI001909C11C|nr:PASTA domain-containing protein [Streptomyces sp. MBT62]MBK3567101.1 PASTA domain-containing protein [Streptomyces sp. MBT62]